MIWILTGNDRVRLTAEVQQILGEDYEILEGKTLEMGDLPSIFWGNSLFATERRILIRDLGENKEAFEQMAEFAGTTHKVVLLEGKVDKRTAAYKALIEAGAKEVKYDLAEADSRLSLRILDTAWRDGARAVRMVEKIEQKEDAFRFVGLMVTQAVKKYQMGRGAKERRVILELAKLDMEMKGEQEVVKEPWTLVKAFLLRVGKM